MPYRRPLDIPHGDILIHAGDLTQSGSFEELQASLDWLNRHPHPNKLVIAGNHDLLLDSSLDATASGGGAAAAERRQRLDWGDIIYLQNSTTEITCPNGRRLRVYGSPNSCRHGNWAFQYPRSESGKTWLGKIPDDIDILITHGPPRAHLDILRLGCPALLEEVWRVRPRLHVFGHVHEGYGREWLNFDALQEAYERTIIAGGLCNAIRVMIEFVRAMLRSKTEAKTLLVNPSMVGV
ncbi:putative rhamnogalacturonate lyase C [Cytospora mali]|uniref:Rhamnogalacturonate lyase C n=1 Tax=Cytospora mali TaxID=578113 RepID=A0A194W9X3_CYTMA|nr:putative rhamnogalacturonate lyase C [Valsa mali]